MTDKLLTPTHEIIRCCDALLSEADGVLNEKQRDALKIVRNKAASVPDLFTDMYDNRDAYGLTNPMIRHEIVNPINHIIGYSDLLSSGEMGLLNETQQQNVKIINVSGRHILTLILDILQQE